MTPNHSDFTISVKQVLDSVNPALWALAIAFWGGVIGFFSRVTSGSIERFTISRFMIEMASSIFSATIVFMICLTLHLNEFLIAAFVGVAAHMGSALLNEIERHLVELVKRRFK